MADNVVINIDDTSDNILVNVISAQDFINVDAAALLARWGTIVGVLSTQTDLWSRISADRVNFDLLNDYLSTNNVFISSLELFDPALSSFQNIFDIFVPLPLTLTYEPSSFELSISYGNTVSLSSLKDATLSDVIDYLSSSNVLMSAATITTDLSVGGTIFSNLTAIVFASYITPVGDGVNNNFNILHNLGTTDVSVIVRDLQTNILAFPSIRVKTPNEINVAFSFAPQPSGYNVAIFGGVPSNRVVAYGGFVIPERPKSNSIYVSLSGNDLNSGSEPYFAVRTIKRACEIAHNARARSKNNPDIKFTVFVETGDYYEENPIYIPPNVSLIGDNLRRVSIRPINRQLDILWCDNSVYVWGVTFRDHLEDSAATAFPILSNPMLTSIAFKNLLTPYVSSTLTYDRSRYIRDIGLILSAVEVDIVNGNNNETVNKGLMYYTGTTINLPQNQILPLAQAFQQAKELSKFYVVSEVGVLSIPSIELTFSTVINILTGGVTNYTPQTFTPSQDAFVAANILDQRSTNIQNETIEYLDTVLYPDITKWRKPFITTSPYIQGSSSITRALQTTLQQPICATQIFNTQAPISAPLSKQSITEIITTITNIIDKGPALATSFSFTTASDATIAANLINQFTPYIQEQTIEFIDNLYPDMAYDKQFYTTNINYVLTAVQTDIQNGNNNQAVINGLAYFDNTGTLVLSSDQKLPIIYAIEKARDLTLYVVDGIYTDRVDLDKTFDTVNDILIYGVNGFTPKTWVVAPGALSATALLNLNDQFIKREVLEFVKRINPNLSYDPNIWEQYINQILNAVKIDILNGNNIQTILRGLSFYTNNVLNIPQNQLPALVGAINYTKRLAKFIATNSKVQALGSGSGMRVDGKDAEGFLRSFVLDSYTQFNEGGRGIYITNNGYAQLVSIFTICCTEGIRTDLGGTCSINNSNCSFGLSGIVAVGKSPTPILSGTLQNNPFATDLVLVNNVNGIDIQPNSDYYSPFAPIDTRKIAYAPYNGLLFTIGNDRTLYTVSGNPALSGGTTSYIINVPENIRNNYETGETVRFYLRSTITTSSHTFEYIGSGIVLAEAVPALGGVSTPETEAVYSDGGIIYFTSTNQAGDFRVGQEFTIVQETGTISGETFQRSILTLVTPLNLALE